MPAEYGAVLMVALTICIYVTLVGFIYGGKTRGDTFDFETMFEFSEEHKKAFGKDTEPDKNGYPDNGSGRYSKKLDYKAWYEFNAFQR